MLSALLIILTILIINNCNANVLVTDNTMSRMIEISATAPFCLLHNDRGIIQKMLFNYDPTRVRRISTNLLMDLERTCKASHKGFKVNFGIIPIFGLMFPGTKWCGPGNLASSYYDLGFYSAEDRCCREHDHCPKSIPPFKCISGICNNSPFVRSHCDCDAKFRRCLQHLNTEVANTLGFLYFNIVQATCFKERRPCYKWQKIGYAEEMSSKLCSQLKFQPTEKYVPLMPISSK